MIPSPCPHTLLYVPNNRINDENKVRVCGHSPNLCQL